MSLGVFKAQAEEGAIMARKQKTSGWLQKSLCSSAISASVQTVEARDSLDMKKIKHWL